MIIGITGKAGAGKDSIADRLVAKHGFTRDSLAAPLKRCVQDMFQVSETWMNNRVLRERDLPDWPGWSVRKLLQFVGTDLFRAHISPDIWVKLLCHRIACRAHLGEHFVITDVRFDNEDEYLRKEFGSDYQLWYVSRPGFEGAPSGIAGHPSEAGITAPINVGIRNDGTLDDLNGWVDTGIAKW